MHAASMHDISRLDFAACVDVHHAVTCLYMPNAWSSATYKAASACTVQENQDLHTILTCRCMPYHNCSVTKYTGFVFAKHNNTVIAAENPNSAVVPMYLGQSTLFCTELHAHYRRMYKPDNI